MALSQLLGVKKALALRTEPKNIDAVFQQTIDWLGAKPNRRILTLSDAHYPRSLLQLTDAPTMIYLQGNMPIDSLDKNQGIAMVGSRSPTPQGLMNAKQFARYFSHRQIPVVSGMATGIDTASHEGALQGQGFTVAVVGTGLDKVYPRQNHTLAQQISANGLLISEFEIGTPPLANHFPRRNRIIAAISQGCLVVEATRDSGSLITARSAIEIGKEVFAIPGSIHAPQYKGCHKLIKEGAKLVEDAEDVFSELHPRLHLVNKKKNLFQKPKDSGLIQNQQQKLAVEIVSNQETDHLLATMGFDPVSLDDLQLQTQLSTAKLQSQLLELELMNKVTRLPGGLYQRIEVA